MDILAKILSVISVFLLILCMLSPLRKTDFAQKRPFFKQMVGFHTLYGILLLITGLAHGILSGREPGMITGKLAWMVLLVLTIASLFKKKMRPLHWKYMHIGLASVVCILIGIHIIYSIAV